MDNEEKQYFEKVYLMALSLWGKETVKMKEHLEKTATAVHRIGQIKFTSDVEPVTKMNLGEKDAAI